MADTPEGSRLTRLLAKADSRNQVVLDAASGRAALTGSGVVFVASPHFADGEWREYQAPSVAPAPESAARVRCG